MELEISPEPSPEEREAIARALALLSSGPPDERGAWWREGVGEDVSPEGEPA